MKVRFSPSLARGTVAAPPSKTLAHRELMAAALSERPSTVSGVLFSEDVLATLDCARSLGAEVLTEGDRVRIVPGAGVPSSLFPCRESGSTLRFFLPQALRRNTESVFTGSPRLLERPLDVYEELCRENGNLFRRDKDGIHVRGPLSPGLFRVRGDISSQFVTGLLFALPHLPGESVLELIPPAVSLPYVGLTLAVLRKSGAVLEDLSPLSWRVPGNQILRARDVTVEGDWSNAAFPEAFGLIGGDVEVTGLDPDSGQGDRAYRTIYPLLREGCPEIDVSDIPDLAPVLMALGGMLHGVILTGTARLKMKESDRGAAMAEELGKFGIRCAAEEDRIKVFPSEPSKPSVPADSHNDHRIAMALSLPLSRTGGELTGAEAVNKSWPGYFDAVRSLGIEVEVI